MGVTIDAARTAMGRFASTVAYYENARPPYGAAFFEAVAQQLGFDRSQRLLDVGAGPGILAIGFAPYCREVAGVDPEPGMVEAARAAAARARVAVKFIEGRFEDVAAQLGVFRRRHRRSRDPLARYRACPSSAQSRPRTPRKG
jgi:predicted RNA methylase